MPFTIRPFHRFAVDCPVTYHAGLFEDHGTESLAEWVASLGGTCHCGSVRRAPSRSICRINKVSLSRLPLCGGCDDEYGVESLVMEKHTNTRLTHYVKRLVQQPAEIIP